MASFCGSGDWEHAEYSFDVPSGKTISSISLHTMYRNTVEGYAVFDDVGITVYDSFSLAVDSSNAFDGSDISRTGHHNDCFLASDTNLGTYLSG